MSDHAANDAHPPAARQTGSGALRKCITGADVLRDGHVADAEALDVWIEGDTIVALTPRGAPPHFTGPVERIDGRDCLAFTGLINGHSHSYSSLLRGTCAGEPLDLFVLEAMSRRAPRTEAMVRIAGLLHSLEMLKRGITAQVDHFRHGALPSVAGVDALFGAYREIGIRATVAPMYEDRPYVESLPFSLDQLPPGIRARFANASIPAPEAYFEMLGEITARWRGVDGRLDVLIGVDGPQRCTERLLGLAADFAGRHDMGNHTHVLEAKTQALVADRVGGSLVGWLDRFGLVTPKSSFAHFVWASDHDVALVAERGATPVHNPGSNFHLGSGVARVPHLLRAGIDVALGTDGGSGLPLNMLEAAKLASLASRITEVDPRQWITSRTAFRMATEHGAKVLGMAGRLGRVAPGMTADLALVDTRGLDWAPRGDVFNHLIMYESGNAIRTVLVGGEMVIRDGKSTRIDEDALLDEARAIAGTQARDNAAALASFEAERPAWLPLVMEALARPAAVERLMHRRA